MTRASEIAQRMQGPVCSVPTVFTRDGEIDLAGMRSVIDRALAAGSGVVMLTWGNSLISLLSDAEVAEVHRAVADHVANRALTIACDSMWGLPKCLEFGSYVRELGFDLYMVRPAEWARGTPQSLAAYYRAVARETPVMLVGDVPIRTCELISATSGICAIKEDLSLDYAHEVLMRWGDRWPMVGGGGMQRHHPHLAARPLPGLAGLLHVLLPRAGSDLLGRAAARRPPGSLGKRDALVAAAAQLRRRYQLRLGRLGPPRSAGGLRRRAALAPLAGP